MANNILDKSAMDTLKELAVVVPQLATKSDVTEINHELDKRVSILENKFGDVANNIKDALEQEPLRCPFRDSAVTVVDHKAKIDVLEKEQKEHGKKIASLETSIKIVGGVNAVISAAFSTISGFLSSLK